MKPLVAAEQVKKALEKVVIPRFPESKLTPLEAEIAKTFEPVDRLPAVYRLYAWDGGVQVFRLPAHNRQSRQQRRR